MIGHAYFAFMELLLVIMFFIMKLMIYNSFFIFPPEGLFNHKKKALNTILISKQFFLFSSAFTCYKTIFSGIELGD